MRAWAWLGTMLVACTAACGSAPTPVPAPPPAPAPAPVVAAEEDEVEACDTPAAEEPVASVVLPDAGPPPPPSTASYEQATAVPESIGLGDDHLHLTDNQLNEPMRGVLVRCRVPPNAKVTIKTAVQYGRAIGVTVLVDLPKPRSPKKGKGSKPPKDVAKARAKAIARISSCADHAVRDLTWPPSRRRDGFTTTF